ncbi:hypothetical protein ACWDT6_30330, partial [Nocardia grenadensis]
MADVESDRLSENTSHSRVTTITIGPCIAKTLPIPPFPSPRITGKAPGFPKVDLESIWRLLPGFHAPMFFDRPPAKLRRLL